MCGLEVNHGTIDKCVSRARRVRSKACGVGRYIFVDIRQVAERLYYES